MIRRRKKDGAAAVVSGALAEADRLFSSGRELDAIESLTAANSKTRDPRIEQRLVDMRFEAFRRMHWSRPANVPNACDDLFPGAAIPEIGRDDFDVEHLRSALIHHGSLLVRKMVDDARVGELIEDIDLALAAYDSHAAGADLTSVAPRYVPFAGEQGGIERRFRASIGSVLAVDSPPALFDVIEAFESAGIGPIVQQYFGERPALLAKKWTLRRVSHAAGPSDWHQDGAFMGGDIRSLNVWLALSHCGDDAPGLDVVTRRLDRVVETGTEGAHLTWTVGPGMVERVAAGAVARPIFEPGDALIFDHLSLHRTAVDPEMTRDRYAIEAWFLAPSTYETMLSDIGENKPPRDQLPLIY